MNVDVTEVASPIGTITLALHAGRVCALTCSDHWEQQRAALQRRLGRIELRDSDAEGDVVQRLQAYFAGDLAALDRVRVEPSGTAFQQRVWTALRSIPPGHTASYRDVEHAIGAPSAVRAVGAANGANPIWLVIPCHRVIGADGSLTGYGGGIERKRWLIEHERRAGSQPERQCTADRAL